MLKLIAWVECANIRGNEYDFLVFIYAPSKIINACVVPTYEREIYVFPQSVIEATPKGETGKNFNPKYIIGYEKYKKNFKKISEALI